MQSKQSGSSDIEAITKALVNSTQSGEKTYRSQSLN
jgi:hypothetical protein